MGGYHIGQHQHRHFQHPRKVPWTALVWKPPSNPGIHSTPPRDDFGDVNVVMSLLSCKLSSANTVSSEWRPDPSLWSHVGPISALLEFTSADLQQVQNAQLLYNPRAFALASP